MALEGNTFKHGGTVFPLTASTSNSLLLDADPAVYYTLSYLASVIQTYAGSRLAAEANAAGLTIATAVAYQLPDEPTRYLTEEQVKFPLLAVYRTRGDFADRTMTWRHDTGEWRVAYVLPPVTAGQRERLQPILHAVSAIVDNRLERQHDEGYLSDASWMGSSYANLETIRCTSYDIAAWEDGGDLTFPALIMTLEVKERVAPIAAAYDAMTRIDVKQDNTATGETTLADLVQTQTSTT
jgi:hypothetical protein